MAAQKISPGLWPDRRRMRALYIGEAGVPRSGASPQVEFLPQGTPGPWFVNMV